MASVFEQRRFYQENCPEIHQDMNCTNYAVRCPDGKGLIICRQVFPGVEVSINDFHAHRCLECYDDGDPFQLDFCCAGKFSCAFSEQESCVLEPGALAAHQCDRKNDVEGGFPLGHYRGVNLTIDFEQAADFMRRQFGVLTPDFAAIQKRILSESWLHVWRADTGCMAILRELFLGTFDGSGHTISNLTFQTGDYMVGAGLFGINCGIIRNLSLVNVDVTVTDGTSQAIGGVVGYNMGAIDGITLKNASVTGNNCTGGIVGGNMGPVSNCRAEDVEIIVIGNNDFSAGLVQDDVAECGGLVIGGGFGGTIDNCMASGVVRAEGNEPVGLGGIGGCLEMMDSITNCSAAVTIETANGGHAIGGLCGYAGTHSNPDVCLETEGFSTTNYPSVVDNCSVQVTMKVPGATHVGGLIGTGLYYYGEETAFTITNCRVSGSIDGAVSPGAVAGRAEGSTVDGCTFEVRIDEVPAENAIGKTTCMYESADQ